MKKTFLLLFFFSVLAVSFYGCKKEKPPPDNPIIKLGPNTVWIDDATSQTLVQVDTAKIIFNGNTTQLQNLKVGDIITSSIAPNAPYGYLRKILSIQKNGNQYDFTTQEIPFTDAFEELHVNYTKAFTINDTASGKKENLQFTVNFPNVVIYDNDGSSSTTADRITLNGHISMSPTISANVDISAFHLDYAKIEASLETEIQSQLVIGGNLALFSEEIPIYIQPLAALPIPGTPIVIVPILRVNVGANGSVNVQVSATYTNTNTVTAYIEYSNSVWDKGSSHSMQNTYNFSGITGTVNAKAYVEPGIDFSFFGSHWATGSVVAQGYAKFTGTFLPTIGCELKAGISAGVEANVQIFGMNFASISYPDIFDYSTILYTCSGGNPQAPVADFSASQTTINVGQAINFTDLSTNTPTSWQWTFQGGTPSSSTQQNPTGIAYNAAGTYNVTLTATNGVGNNAKTKTGYIIVSQTGSAPVADFSASQTSINVGQSINFTDLSTNSPTSWQWTFTGASPSSSPSKNPNGIAYNTAGTYNVTLTATNTNGSDTKTKNTYITVTQSGGTGCGGITTVTDIDGNVYNVVELGNQCWTKENLKTAHYRDGTTILDGNDSLTWENLFGTQTGAWCYYGGSSANEPIYGKLYNWNVTNDVRGICPNGWHIAINAEWDSLVSYLGGSNVAGGAMKSTTLWTSPNTGATNTSGFTVLPAGARNYYGSFVSLHNYGTFWSATPASNNSANFYQLSYNYSTIGHSTYNRVLGYSCRCLKD